MRALNKFPLFMINLPLLTLLVVSHSAGRPQSWPPPTTGPTGVDFRPPRRAAREGLECN